MPLTCLKNFTNIHKILVQQGVPFTKQFQRLQSRLKMIGKGFFMFHLKIIWTLWRTLARLDQLESGTIRNAMVGHLYIFNIQF